MVTKKRKEKTDTPLLEVRDLQTYFYTADGTVRAVDGVDLNVYPKKTLGIVGESGCGKSITTKSILRLIDRPGRIINGTMNLYDQDHKNPQDIATLDSTELKKVRGGRISMIFQEPMTSLNPVYTIGEQIGEILRRHKGLNRKQSFLQALDLIEAVQIPDPKNKIHSYPFQLSGGQRQRVMIAMALACEPKILVADEPTTALDVTVQAQIFDLLKELRAKTNTAIILITHDMGVVYEMAQKMIVMYAGRKVEEGSVNQVIKSPAHPYTQGLISCVPHLTEKQPEVRERLLEIPGIVPSLTSFGLNKCLFESRCHKSVEKCLSSKPDAQQILGGHKANCWNLGK